MTTTKTITKENWWTFTKFGHFRGTNFGILISFSGGKKKFHKNVKNNFLWFYKFCLSSATDLRELLKLVKESYKFMENNFFFTINTTNSQWVQFIYRNEASQSEIYVSDRHQNSSSIQLFRETLFFSIQFYNLYFIVLKLLDFSSNNEPRNHRKEKKIMRLLFVSCNINKNGYWFFFFVFVFDFHFLVQEHKCAWICTYNRSQNFQ